MFDQMMGYVKECTNQAQQLKEAANEVRNQEAMINTSN